jgi:hypothetical protein
MGGKYKYLIASFFISPVIFFFVLGLFVPSSSCQLQTDFKKSTFTGVLINKYLDMKNHAIKTLDIKIVNKEINLILPRDTSSFFDYVLIGDTLLKTKSDSVISVIRMGSLKKFKIYFGCDE